MSGYVHQRSTDKRDAKETAACTPTTFARSGSAKARNGIPPTSSNTERYDASKFWKEKTPQQRFNWNNKELLLLGSVSYYNSKYAWKYWRGKRNQIYENNMLLFVPNCAQLRRFVWKFTNEAQRGRVPVFCLRWNSKLRLIQLEHFLGVVKQRVIFNSVSSRQPPIASLHAVTCMSWRIEHKSVCIATKV